MNATDAAIIAEGTKKLTEYGQFGKGVRTETPTDVEAKTETEDVVITFGSTSVALRRNDDGPFLEFVNHRTRELFTLDNSYPIRVLLDHLES